MTLAIISSIICLALGFVVGRYLFQKVVKSDLILAEAQASKIVKDAETQAAITLKNAEVKAQTHIKDQELKNKERLFSSQREHDKEINNKNKKILETENRIKQKELATAQKLEQVAKRATELDAEQEQLAKQIALFEERQKDLDKARKDIADRLEKVAGMTVEDARNQLIESLKNDARARASSQVREIVEEAQLTANKEAKKIVIQAIQRTATEHAIENAISVFNIKSDDIKGQIIGREGRNIRALEQATGVEIIVDDTPEAILLSCFDPMRREIARLSLHRLVSDGRIHPARIEEVVAKTRKEIEEEVAEIGERTCIELGVHGLHADLVRMVGKMRYRSSYGQNLLQHSREVANLCAIMASELGLNTKLAKRAGLLHDIGKVSDENPELPHAILGMKIAEKCKENPVIRNAIGAHHDEIEMTHPISAIIQACDAISGSRPGARREVVESYIKRLKELENIAVSFDGVERAFAIQAGRELRVIVESERINDDRAEQISGELSDRIQNEMQYPGQIKITVIREKRAVSYAR